MPEIIIRSFAKFRELFGGTNSITVPPETTVSGTLLAFAKTRSASMDELFSGAELKTNIILMYNRERIDAEDAKTIIPADGDEIVIYPPVSGG